MVVHSIADSIEFGEAYIHLHWAFDPGKIVALIHWKGSWCIDVHMMKLSEESRIVPG